MEAVRRIIVFLILVLFQFQVQSSSLEDPISYSFTDKDFGSVLGELSEIVGFDYAYNPASIEPGLKLSGDYDSVSVKKILEDLSKQAGLKWNLSGSIVRFRTDSKLKEKSSSSTVSGKIVLQGSGGMSASSIKEPNLNYTGGTDEDGNFGFFLPVPEYPLKLRIESPGYEEKTVHFNPKYQRSFFVTLQPDTNNLENEVDENEISPVYSEGDSVRVPEITDYFPAKHLIPDHLVKNAQSSEFIREQDVQGSIVAGTGNNGEMCGVYKNNFSFNLLTGYSAGVNGLEMGAINVNRFHVSGLQIGIIGNSTGGQVRGAQFSYFYNQSLLGTTGLQYTGFYNESRQFARGMQAGLVNMVWGKMYGFQAAGLFNYVEDETYGLQASGLVNYSDTSVFGMQASGLVNSAQNIYGAQISALNRTEGLYGFQAGVVNYSRKNSGFQLGVVNIADTVHGGFFGLVNVFRGGYRSIQASADETNSAQLIFKSGLRSFYTLFGGGYSVRENKDDLFKVSGGLGTQILRKLPINFQSELWYSLYFNENESDHHLGTLSFLLQIELFKSVTFFAGPTANFYASRDDEYLVHQINNPQGNTDFRPLNHQGYILWEQHEPDVFMQVWAGARLGLGINF